MSGQSVRYCAVGDIKAMMPDLNWGASYDAIFESLSMRASRLIDYETGKAPGSFANTETAEIRYFDGSGTSELWIDETPALPSVIAVATDGMNYVNWATPPIYFTGWPYNAISLGVPFLRLDLDIFRSSEVIWYKYPRSVKLTSVWGYSVRPPDLITQAAIMQSIRWFKRGQAGFADTAANPNLTQLSYTSRLDPEIAEMLDLFKRTTI